MEGKLWRGKTRRTFHLFAVSSIYTRMEMYNLRLKCMENWNDASLE
jgi:hypothetical protein